MKPHKWTEEEIDWVRENVRTKTHKQCAEELKEIFGIETTDKAVNTLCKRNGILTGRTGRFEKGQESINKGKKMVYHSEQARENTKKGQFKKGEMPVQHVPIGTETLHSDGYVLVKVTDDRSLPSRKNWRFKHRVVWEKAHGPIPEGHCVVFLDGDRLNFDLDNLLMVPNYAKSIFAKKYGYTGDKELNKANWLLAVTEAKVRKEEKHGRNNRQHDGPAGQCDNER